MIYIVQFAMSKQNLMFKMGPQQTFTTLLTVELVLFKQHTEKNTLE